MAKRFDSGSFLRRAVGKIWDFEQGTSGHIYFAIDDVGSSAEESYPGFQGRPEVRDLGAGFIHAHHANYAPRA